MIFVLFKSKISSLYSLYVQDYQCLCCKSVLSSELLSLQSQCSSQERLLAAQPPCEPPRAPCPHCHHNQNSLKYVLIFPMTTSLMVWQFWIMLNNTLTRILLENISEQSSHSCIESCSSSQGSGMNWASLSDSGGSGHTARAPSPRAVPRRVRSRSLR